jgi:hypothetical protein
MVFSLLVLLYIKVEKGYICCSDFYYNTLSVLSSRGRTFSLSAKKPKQLYFYIVLEIVLCMVDAMTNSKYSTRN